MGKNFYSSICCVLLLWLHFSSGNLVAQNFVIIEGRVTNISGVPIPNAHILNRTKKLGTITDDFGGFKIFASSGDSMLVSSMGYKSYKAIVPPHLQYKVFSLHVVLVQDTIMLKETIIRAYPATYDQFKKEFVGLKIEKKSYEKLFSKITDKQYNPKGGIVMAGPISVLYNAFSHEAKVKRKLAALMYRDNLRAVVYDKIPKDVLIKAYHFKTESDLEQFLDYCSLSENLIVNASAYELVVALNWHYQNYPKK